ncbi:MAG: hypothetical protein ABIR59_09710 [Gemmatimonadales bacterium]
MAIKLTSRQQAQLQWLQLLPPKFDRIFRVVEQLSTQQADDVQLRSLTRLLDELKAQASGLNIGALADTFGYMGMLLRRGGGHQLKVRGLRELLVGAKINYEGALRSASEEIRVTGDEKEPMPSP